MKKEIFLELPQWAHNTMPKQHHLSAYDQKRHRPHIIVTYVIYANLK